LTRFFGDGRHGIAIAGAIGLFAALMTTPGAAQTPVAPVSDSGRYQVFLGEFPFTNLDGELYWNKALFRIDTVKG
jgi:hypothetical protein